MCPRFLFVDTNKSAHKGHHPHSHTWSTHGRNRTLTSHPHNKKKMKIGRERKVASEHVESDLRYHRQRSPMSPSIYIIAGPNGVGKTTFAREFLPNYANCRHFISADLIALALSRIKGRYFDASLVGERTSMRPSVLSETRTGARSGLVSTHTQCDRECKL